MHHFIPELPFHLFHSHKFPFHQQKKFLAIALCLYPSFGIFSIHANCISNEMANKNLYHQLLFKTWRFAHRIRSEHLKSTPILPSPTSHPTPSFNLHHLLLSILRSGHRRDGMRRLRERGRQSGQTRMGCRCRACLTEREHVCANITKQITIELGTTLFSLTTTNYHFLSQ